MKIKIAICAALIAALLLSRLLCSWYKPSTLLAPDSCYYIDAAKNVKFEGKLYVDQRAGVDKYMTVPLYPIAVAFASLFTKDFEAAGNAVSAISTFFLIAAIFFFAARIFNPTAGFCAAAIAACATAKLSNYILTESMFTLFYTLSAWLIWETVKKVSTRNAILAGTAVGLAALTREAAFIAIPFGAAAIIFAGRINDERAPLKKKIIASSLFAAAACITITPYWIYSLSVRGAFWGSRFAERSTETGGGSSVIALFISAFPVGVQALIENIPIIVSIAAILGVLLPELSKDSDGLKPRVFLMAWILWNAAFIAALGVTHLEMAGRYLYPVLPITSILAGRAVTAAGETALGFLKTTAQNRIDAVKLTVSITLTIILVSVSYRDALRNIGKESAPRYMALQYSSGTEETAYEFRAEYKIEPGTYVYDRKPFIAYYLGASWAGLRNDASPDHIFDGAEKRPRLLVIDSEIMKAYDYPGLWSLPLNENSAAEWKLIFSKYLPKVGHGGRVISIYSYGDDYRPSPETDPAELDYSSNLMESRKWFGLGRLDRAEKHLIAALALDQTRPEVYVLIGKIMAIKGMTFERVEFFDQAIEALQRALVLDPKNDDAMRVICGTSKAKSEIDGTPEICH